MNARSARIAALAAAGMLAGSVGAVPPAAGAADVSRTVVVLDSEAGDTVGLGRAWTFVPPDDTLAAGGSAAVARLRVERGPTSFTLELGAPEGGTLVTGAYEGATYNGGAVPRLAVHRDSQVCFGGGRFDVLEAPAFDAGGTMTAFAADFRFGCEAGGPGLRGSIRVGSAVDVRAVRASADAIDFGQANLFEPGGPRPVVYANVGSLPVAMGQPVVAGDGAGSFSVATDCPPTLDPDASCAVSVRFAPEQPSWIGATLSQPSDATSDGHVTSLGGLGTAVAVANDSPEEAIAFSSLPFGHGGTTSGLTGSGTIWNSCPGDYETLWYAFTSPTRQVLRLESALGLATLSVLTSLDAQPIACGPDGPVTFTAEAGVTYWIKIHRRWPGPELLGVKASAGPADTEVQASGIGVSRTTFYPVVDGYLDTVTMRGTRDEKASVAVSIYSSSGTKVRSLSAPLARGSYAIAWNGRSTSGSLVAAGTYRVVQTVTDLWSNQVKVTSSVTVSRKKLYTYAYSRTRDGGDYSATGKSGTGSISRSRSSYAGGVRIATGRDGVAGVGYAFTVPSATVYKSVKFEVLGRGNGVAGAGTEVGVQAWARCTDWDDGCVDEWSTGPMDYGWAGIKVAGKGHVSGARRVRGYVEVWAYGDIIR